VPVKWFDSPKNWVGKGGQTMLNHNNNYSEYWSIFPTVDMGRVEVVKAEVRSSELERIGFSSIDSFDASHKIDFLFEPYTDTVPESSLNSDNTDTEMPCCI